jgi:hypothetical protein
METWRHVDMKAANEKGKTEARAIFLCPFTVCSSSKRKFVVCLFVDEETNGSYPFANGLNRLGHLWLLLRFMFLFNFKTLNKL